MFLMVKFDCGMNSRAATPEGAGVSLDKENQTLG